MAAYFYINNVEPSSLPALNTYRIRFCHDRVIIAGYEDVLGGFDGIMQHDQPTGAVSSTASNKSVRARADDSTSTSDIPITIKVLLTHALVYLSVGRKHCSGLAAGIPRRAEKYPTALSGVLLLLLATTRFFAQLPGPNSRKSRLYASVIELFSAAPPASSIYLGHILATKIRDHR
ncbi:hypothetical protein E4U32_001037 [Claviceps aff. humidiphila group G2b]|nr:hypothetical protein E4U32_001037 [Claviceps aff. humidiphila group G2b]